MVSATVNIELKSRKRPKNFEVNLEKILSTKGNIKTLRKPKTSYSSGKASTKLHTKTILVCEMVMLATFSLY